MANISIKNRKKITFTPQIIQDYERGRCNFVWGGGKVVLKYKVTSPTPVDEDFPLGFFTTNPGALLDIEVTGGTINGGTSLQRELRAWTSADLVGKSGSADLRSHLDENVRVKFDSELTVTITVKPSIHTTYAWSPHLNNYVTLAFDCQTCVRPSSDEDMVLKIYATFLGERAEYNANGCHTVI